MACRYPNTLGVIEEVTEGCTVTVSLRTSSGLGGTKILAGQPADTIDEARGIIAMFARDCWICDDDIEIDIRLDLSPRHTVSQIKPQA